MKFTLTNASIIALVLIPVLYSSCNKDDDPQIDEVALMIEEVRQLTQPFKNHSAAVQAGWDTDISSCIEHPTEGGMGHHFGRMPYFDGRTNHLEPQVLLFAPDINGNMELLGVEYIVPFTIHSEEADPPTLFYQHFHQNHEQEIWGLHVWTEKLNPKGMFYDWNPTVSCD